jgi:DNA-binding NtrC family response regulator
MCYDFPTTLESLLMKKNILVIEDEATTKLLYREAFKGESFEVHWAGDGFTAMSLLKQTPIDLVVTDILMPLVGGGAIISHLNLYYPDIPVIVVTAHPDDQELREEQGDNVRAFFTKPVDLKTLKETIAKLLV